MIPRAAITQWRAEHAPWPLDEQVEQDLIISRALVDLFNDPLIAATMAFRGGTALNKLYFEPAARYSEDIDLVQIVPGDIGPALTAIRDRLAWLGIARYAHKDKLVTLTFKFTTEFEPVSTRKLKVEINTREHFSVQPLIHHAFAVESLAWKYSGSTSIPTYSFEELLGTKLRALYERRKGRDVFDLAYAMQQSTPPDLDAVIECFLEYVRRDGHAISRAKLESNFDDKCKYPGFLQEVNAFLAPGVSFDPVADPVRVRDLLARLPK